MALYVFGSNTMCQLGLPEDDVSTTHVPTPHPFFEDKEIVRVACGKLHTLVLCKDNKLYTWGVNDDCALGREGNEEVPELVDFKHTIVDMCGGASFSALLTDRGQVFACGTFKSTSGIIGFDEKTKFQPVFTRFRSVRGIKKIYAGQNHIIMIDRSSNIWAVGANESHQLGYSNRPRHPKRCLEPSQVSTKKYKSNEHNFITAAGGGFHTVAVNKEGTAYAWGSNFNGQLGDGTYTPSEEKRKVELGEIKGVSCGLNHTLMLAKDGKLYGSGDNSMHQLGLDAGKTVKDPQLILEGVTNFTAGCDFSIAQKGNKLYSCGSNLSGECGFEDEEIETPREIPFDFGNIIDFACGSDFTIVVTK